MNLRLTILLFSIVSIVIGGCNKSYDPQVSLQYTEVTNNGVKLIGKLENDGGKKVTEYGFCWGYPNSGWDTYVVVQAVDGNFEYTVEGLEYGQEYNFAAFAKNRKAEGYSQINRDFITRGFPYTNPTCTIATNTVEGLTQTISFDSTKLITDPSIFGDYSFRGFSTDVLLRCEMPEMNGDLITGDYIANSSNSWLQTATGCQVYLTVINGSAYVMKTGEIAHFKILANGSYSFTFCDAIFIDVNGGPNLILDINLTH